MPWQDNSGNNGGPTRGPWGQPPRGNGDGGGRGPRRGNEPPDLEELLQASRQRLKRAFPRNGGGGGRGGGGPQINGRTIGFGAVVLLGLWLLSGIYVVGAQQLGVVTTFGKYAGVSSPGLHWRIPSPIQNVKIETVTVVRTSEVPVTRAQRGGVSEGLMLTGDKNIVDVEMNVQWVIGSSLGAPEGEFPPVAKYVFNIRDQEQLVLAVGEAAIREVVGRNTLDFVQTTGRSEVQEQTRSLMQATLDMQDAGVEIREVNLEKADPPTAEVNEAFLDVEAAKQDKEQFINTARAYANRVVPEARGQAQQILEESRAYSAQVTANARGQADRFNSILGEYQKAPEVTRQRMYLETMERVLGPMNKIIVEDDAGSGVVPYLPLNEINRKAPAQ